MKIIKIDLSKKQMAELKQLQRKSGDYRSERALAVIHCSEGKTATEIAKALKRQINTVCNWLNAFINHGVEGLSRKYSEGRPNKRSSEVLPRVQEYLEKSPNYYGFSENLWTIKLFQIQYEKETQDKISEDTVRRALHEAGYSCKRPKKSPPNVAPSKEEKQERIKEIINEIKELSEQAEVEVMFIDESHFFY